MPSTRHDFMFSGQFVATLWDIPLNVSKHAAYRRAHTHGTLLPAGAVGVVTSQPTPQMVRYTVLFLTRPVLTLRMRPRDIEPIELDLLINCLGDVGFATWTKQHTPVLPAYMRSGQDVETQRNDG